MRRFLKAGAAALSLTGLLLGGLTSVPTPAGAQTLTQPASISNAPASGTVVSTQTHATNTSLPAAAPGPYSPISPVRICDTRPGNPSNLSGPAAQCGGHTMAAGTTVTVAVQPNFTVPSTATAVIVNVTAVNPTGAGYLTVFPTGQPTPTASNLNVVPGLVVANLVEVGTGTSGDISVFSSVGSDVIVDLQGYVNSTPVGGAGSGLYQPLASPVRVCDTRNNNPSSLTGPAAQCNSQPLSAGGHIAVTVAGQFGVPANATAVVANVTAVAPAGPGYLSVYPDGLAQPPTVSNVNFSGGQVIPNRVTTELGGNGKIDVLLSQAGNVIVDISGYYTGPAGSGTEFLPAPAPVRICDTRPNNPSNLTGDGAQCNGANNAGETLNSGGILTLNVAGHFSVPTGAVAAVVNVTAIFPSNNTFLTVYPGPSLPTPLTSDLNPAPGQVEPNVAVATLTPGGTFKIYNNYGKVDLAVDLAGWYATVPTAPTGLLATTGYQQAGLSWTAPSSAGGSTITGYNVYEGTTTGGESTTPVNGGTPITGTNYTVTGLTNGTQYFFTVKAVNAVGSSPASNEASATPAVTVPTAPTSLGAVPSPGQVAVSWTAPSSNGGSTITGYNVYEGTTAGGESATPVNGGTLITATNYNVTGLTNGTTYFFTVKAVNAIGSSPASNEASATPALTVPTAPTGLMATPSNQQVALSWAAPSSDGGSTITGYNVYEGTASGGESATPVNGGTLVTATNYAVTGLTNGTQYFFTVKAVNSVGSSSASNEASATPVATVNNLISGAVTATTGGGALGGVNVFAIKLADGLLSTDFSQATTNSGGNYSFNLPAGTYDVCFQAASATGGSSTTGYQGQCHQSVAWNYTRWQPAVDPYSVYNLPNGLTSVNATTPQVVNASLPTGGAISGKVTDSSANGLTGARVEVFDTSGDPLYPYDTTTAVGGTYTIPGLIGANYFVCFDGSGATGGVSTLGYGDQCYNGKPWDGVSSPSIPAATPVAVTAGSTTSAINATLATGGEITGTVTDASNTGLASVKADLYTANGSLVRSTTTAANGSYTVSGVAAGNYFVCFDASSATGGSSATGYLDQCYNGVSWDGFSDPAATYATSVNVKSGVTTSGIGAKLPTSAEIHGTVTDTSSPGRPVADVLVEVYTSSGFANSTTTSASGTYSFQSLPSGSYFVCFETANATGGASTAGYLDQCYNSKAWDGFTQPASPQDTIVSVTAGAASTVNASLTSAGGISGTVTDTSSPGQPLAGVLIDVYDASGNFVAGSDTSASGTYSANRLPAGSYFVCFEASNATGGASTTGYMSQCYNGKAWNIPPSSPQDTPVPVTTGATTAGVNASLARGGAVSGSVTDSSSPGQPLSGVLVSVYDSSRNYYTSASTSASGTYTVGGLPAGSYFVCFSGSGSTGGSSSTGYLDQCYNGKAWDGFSAPSSPTDTLVPVTTGSTSSGINGHLGAAGAISGTVTDTSSHPLANVAVALFDQSGQRLYGMGATTTANGTYKISGLATGTYYLCFDGSQAIGGTSAVGYPSECYASRSWDGFTPPASPPDTAVSVTAGSTSTLNVSLPGGGAISGTVTDTSSPASPVTSVIIDVYDSSGEPVLNTFAQTAADGTYTLGGLVPGTYFVCFGTAGAIGPSSTGYLPQCFNGKAWDGYTWPSSSTATVVAVTAGATTTGINASLPVAGAISGTVTDASSPGQPLSNVRVTVFDSSGRNLQSGITSPSGAYRVTGLSTGSHFVCFDASNATGGASTTGYLDQCYNGKSWDGSSVPSSPTDDTVSVTVGAATAVNVSLGSAGAIRGTVTDASSPGQPLTAVEIQLYTSTGQFVYGLPTSTSSSGTYTVTHLPAGSYFVCFNAASASGGASTTGYLNQCFNGKSWDGSTPPSSSTATVVSVTGGSTATANASLPPAGAIGGTVTDTSSPAQPLANVFVEVFDSSGMWMGGATTSPSGTYKVTGLPAGSTFVCFETSAATGGASSTGYVDQCYNGKAWDGSTSPTSSSATGVAVTGGATATVNASLPAGGEISGTVTDSSSPAQPLASVRVSVFTQAGQFLVERQPTSSGNGTYTVKGLVAGSYFVCFDATSATGGASTTGYQDQCYNGKAWDGTTPPSSPTDSPVSVTVGSAATANASLASAGRIAGTVNDTSSPGQPLGDIQVELFDSTGSPLHQYDTSTPSNGTYVINDLPVGSYFVCFSSTFPSGGASTTGYQDQCYSAKAWDGTTPPSTGNGDTAVAVTAGATSTVNASLASAARISGTVTDTSSPGQPLSGVAVDVYNSSGTLLSGLSSSTGSDGTYSIPGLVPGSYFVCFDAASASGGASTTGYLDQCNSAQAWDGSTPPSSPPDTAVAATAGATATVNASLGAAGEISGTVTDTSSPGHPLGNVQVQVFDSSGVTSTFASTNSAGVYSVRGLAAGSYFVCFNGESASGGTSATGYVDQCYSGQAWDGHTSPASPPDTAVAVTAGSNASANASLATGGEISGMVTDSSSPAQPLYDVDVEVYNSSGSFVTRTFTTGGGTYASPGLPAGSYFVCFEATSASYGFMPPPPTGFVDQCYNAQVWDGYSAPASPRDTTVAVTAGADTTVNASLTAGGEVSGTVTDTSSPANPLSGADVELYDSSGTFVKSTSTAFDGTYSLSGLVAGSYFVCINAVSVSGGPSTTGYTDQCYNGQTWDGSTKPTSPPDTSVAVTAGANTTVDASLTAGGEITGTVTDTSSPANPLSNVEVELYNSSGTFVTSTMTAADGTYSLSSLVAGPYYVCFNAASASGGTSATGYADQCYNGQSWDGITQPTSPGDTQVPVTAGLVTTINAKLAANP